MRALERLDRLGPARFALLVVLAPVTLFYLVAGFYAALDLGSLDAVSDHRFHHDDFVTFWAAAHLALTGAAAQAYDPVFFAELERAIAGPLITFTPWHYPPTFQLAVMPLALLPFSVALIPWLLLPFLGLVWVARRFFDSAGHSWLLVFFPGSVICLVSGQNGFLNAFLIGFGLLKLGERPVVAGIALGLLTWKPHIAALVFAALAAGRHWRALGSACVTAAVLALASIAVLGLDSWRAFVANIAYVARLLGTNGLAWERMPSVYVSAGLLGLDVTAAYALQMVVGLAALATVCAIWYRDAPLRWRGAAIAAALPLVTPYVFDYDLVLLAFAFAWLLEACLKDGWRPGDTLLLVAVWAGPALSWPLVKHGGIPFMPVVYALLLAAVWRRAFPGAALSRVPEPRTV